MSDLMKIARAVDGDDWFCRRVQVACELAGVDYNRPTLLRVAQAVVGGITLSGDDGLTVDTSGVTDEAIIAAVEAESTSGGE